MIREDIELEVTTILHEMPACEGVTHNIPKWGHVPAQHATHLVALPCGHDWMMCTGWVTTVPAYTLLRCNGPKGCQDTHLVSELRFTPLDLT
jgi:hypothetical protein